MKARNVLPLLVAHAGKIPLVQVQPEWPAFKPETVFGQLPHLDFGGMKISQVLHCVVAPAVSLGVRSWSIVRH